jgi:hypothetical protein
MKKLYYFFLLLPLWGFGGIAHASVAVQVLGTDFTNKTVTLRVEYDNAVNDRVWVWIYLCSMQGMFEPAVISEATGDNVAYTSTNMRGFFVTASPATVTATLSNATGRFSCCAYGSDTPPNITLSNGTYTFKGTPPFTLIAADGATTQTVTENTLPAAALTMTPVFLTDKTGYPSNFCPYTGSDLYNVAAYLCWQRSNGAQNWEAYIKDSRDNQIYRIVQMPTNTWWMADDLLWDGKPNPDATGYTVRGTARSCGAHYGCGRFYAANAAGVGAYAGTADDKRATDACPSGWLLPSATELHLYNHASTEPDIYLSELEFGGLNSYGLSLYICGGVSGACATSAAVYHAGSGTCFSWWRDRSNEAGCNTNTNSRTVRCVRDL